MDRPTGDCRYRRSSKSHVHLSNGNLGSGGRWLETEGRGRAIGAVSLRLSVLTAGLRYGRMVAMGRLILGVLACALSLPADWLDVKTRQPGDEIQVRSGNLWDWGKFVRASDDVLVIHMRMGEATIARQDIDEVRIFLRKGKTRAKYALRMGAMAAAVMAISYPILRVGGHDHPGLVTGLFASGPGVTWFVSAYTRGSKRIYKRKQ